MAILKVANTFFDGLGNSRLQVSTANTIQVYTSNQERLRVDPGGNVGIGTTDTTTVSPRFASKLAIDSNSTSDTAGVVSVKGANTNWFSGLSLASNQLISGGVNKEWFLGHANTALGLNNFLIQSFDGTTTTTQINVSTSGVITLNQDLAVTEGGTGRSLATAYGVVCGGTTDTSAHQSVSAGASGNVLVSNGPAALPSFLSMSNVQTFTSSGTWSKPAVPSTRFVQIQVWGGGGSGLASMAPGSSGSGGGGYSYYVTPIASLPAATYPITIGAGGTGTTSTSISNSGGVSKFGTLVYAYGGEGSQTFPGTGQAVAGGGTAYGVGLGGGGFFDGGSSGTGGGATPQNNSVYGGGAGAGGNPQPRGLSYFGGDGGTWPGGAGGTGGGGGSNTQGGTSGAGGGGRVIVTVW